MGPAERGPFAYNELNYVHTGVLAALTFLRRIVRKQAHEWAYHTRRTLLSPPSTPPPFSPLFLPFDLPTRARNTHNIGRGETHDR